MNDQIISSGVTVGSPDSNLALYHWIHHSNSLVALVMGGSILGPFTVSILNEVGYQLLSASFAF